VRVLVCGSREFAARSWLEEVLAPLAPKIDTLIEGGAPGADHQAKMWAMRRNIDTETYVAEWRRFGNRAGPIRNQRMLDEGKPDLVIAFPGGRGTADMVRRARSAGIEVREIEG
jgi:hypothetical protein